MSRRPEGHCAICGQHGPLSFEHVPPRKAFNDKRTWYADFVEKVHASAADGRARGRQLQRGQGGYSLCERCNNDTGAWYAPAFVDWCVDSMAILERLGGEPPRVIQVRHCRPLPILKQVLAMFCSVNPTIVGPQNPSVRKFLLDRDARGFWPKLRVFTYYTRSRGTGAWSRSSGSSPGSARRRARSR